MQTSAPLTTAAKHRQSRAAHYNAARQAWRHSKPYLALDDETIEVDAIPIPCPVGRRVVIDSAIVERYGVTVIIPSPWIDKVVNRRAARVLRAHGFELRTAFDSPHFRENYVKELVRFCDKPLRGKRYSAKAWLEWATRKHKELYNAP
jgi:hypothetical protein